MTVFSIMSGTPTADIEMVVAASVTKSDDDNVMSALAGVSAAGEIGTTFRRS